MGKCTDNRTTIVDVWPEWHEETGKIHFVVEVDADTLITIASFVPKSRPLFADATTFEELDISDYGEWYDMALEEAHRQNYVLEGELHT